MDVTLFNLAPDAAEIARKWLQSLASEKRLALKTREAYTSDFMQFTAFLAEHGDAVADKATLESTSLSDFRAFMARRKSDGISSRSLARQVSALRSCPMPFPDLCRRQRRHRLPACRLNWQRTGQASVTAPCSPCSMLAGCAFPRP